MSHHYSDEFPLLRPYGLYAADILGDGNCLFNALSDQMYGYQEKHVQVRSRTIDYMRDHSELFKPYMTCYAGGGVRRNPKRKTAGNASFDATGPSEAEIDKAYEDHLARMAKGGTWGDNMEIVAFGLAFDVNVKIYQRNNAYMVAASGPRKTICHIAYHEWEHYSSIRNLDGPHHGLPNVKQTEVSLDALQQSQHQIHTTAEIPQWKIDLVAKSLPYSVDQEAVFKMLQQCSGNVNNAVDKLLEGDEQRSISSQQSSSVDREYDSSDEPPNGPNKKQDRRLSSRAVIKLRHNRKKEEIASKLDSFGESLDSLINVTHHQPLPPRPKRLSIVTDSDDVDSPFEPLQDGDTSSGSEYSTPSSAPPPPPSTTTGIKLRLKPAVPKPAVSNNSPPKRLVPAREAKANKKVAQKAAAKQRKLAAISGTKKAQQPASEPAQTSFTNGIVGLKTLYI